MERLVVQVAAEVSADRTKSFEAGMALQSGPDLVMEDVFIYPH